MNMHEFNERAIRTINTVRETIDLRPHGSRQDEAVRCYLQDILTTMQNGSYETKGVPIVLLYGRGFKPQDATEKALIRVRGVGVPIDVKCADVNSKVGKQSLPHPHVRRGKKRSTKLRYK